MSRFTGSVTSWLGTKLQFHQIPVAAFAVSLPVCSPRAHAQPSSFADALEESRRILKNAGIDDPVKDLRNLTFSLNWDHGVDYAQSVMRRLQKAERDAAEGLGTITQTVEGALDDIKKVLHRGERYRFP